jgi:hypothetical protein
MKLDVGVRRGAQRLRLTLVVGVEDDLAVASKGSSKSLPEGLETRCIGDDVIVVSAIVVG